MGDQDNRNVRVFAWRDFHRRMNIATPEDVEQARQFAERAGEVRAEVAFLLQRGLTQGAATALGALAEQDMLDFGILLDLAEPVSIPEVEPLDNETRRHLAEFLDDEPWHSLAVDTDVAVALGILKAVAASQAPWFEASPEVVRVVASAMARASAEQLQRFAGEVNARFAAAELPAELTGMLRYVVRSAAERLGTRPPPGWLTQGARDGG